MPGYGIVRPLQVVELAWDVCDVIGHGHHRKAVDLCVETVAAETLLGEFPDRHPDSKGVGLPQIDRGTFDWLKEKYQDSGLAVRIQERLGFALADIRYEQLAYAPLVAMTFMRLRYWVVPKQIPDSRAGRARYWKKHYNSHAPTAKGDPEQYVGKCTACGVDALLLLGEVQREQ